MEMDTLIKKNFSKEQKKWVKKILLPQEQKILTEIFFFTIGLNFTDEMIDNMIESADKNKYGKIQLDEFLEIMLGN